MAKRIGANSRKKYADRKVKVRGAAKKIVLRIIILTLAAAAGVLICFGGFKGINKIAISLKDSSAFDIKAISVQGNSQVETKSVIDKCGIDGKKKIYLVKECSVRAALLKNPWIENVRVIKKIGGKINLVVTERKPIALVNMKAVYYVDKDGILFPIAKKVISDMPVLSGLEDTIDGNGFHKIRSSDMVRVRTFLSKIEATDENCLQKITQINFTGREKIRLTFQAYSTIVELDQANLDMGLRNMIRLEALLQNEVVMPAKINLCYQNLAFVTVKKNVEQKESVQAVAN